ncbi:MAG TPA: hypothetical protein DIU15_10580 [Deltaproteobacteria bacterium]|nr:hypothetical protein [Deltaproteobacteria bacterium]
MHDVRQALAVVSLSDEPVSHSSSSWTMPSPQKGSGSSLAVQAGPVPQRGRMKTRRRVWVCGRMGSGLRHHACMRPSVPVPVCVLVGVLVVCFAPSSAMAQKHGELTGDVLTRLGDEPALNEELLQSLAADPRVDEVVRRPGKWPVYSLLLAAGTDPAKVAAGLSEQAAVRWAEPDRWLVRVPQGAPLNDPYWDQLWHLENVGQFAGALAGMDIHAVPAWQWSTGRGQIVAVLDSGVEAAHPDLDVVEGIDVVDDDADPSPIEGEDGNPHGTAVAGLIAAVGNNGMGVAGVAWESRILPVRLIGGPTTTADHWDAFVVPTDRGAAVLNNSWGFASADEDDPCGPGPGGPSITDPVEYALTEGRGGLGTSVVFSVGNGGCDARDQPILESSGVIAVGAVNDRGQKWGYSNTGPALDVVTPSGDAYGNNGEQLRTTDLLGDRGMNGLGDDNDYTPRMGGTSGSAPLVSGVLALMYAANERLTEAEAREVLCFTADRIQVDDALYDSEGWSERYGCGNVDAAAAVAAVYDEGAPAPPVVLSPDDGERVDRELVLQWRSDDPDQDYLSYRVELFLLNSVGQAEEASDDDDSAPLAAPARWIFDGVTETSIDLSESIELGGDYGVWVVASDAWGEGEPSQTHAFYVREPALEDSLEGSGCTCGVRGYPRDDGHGWKAGLGLVLIVMMTRRRVWAVC